ncbi:S6 family peptidase [Buttiauxella selenatireducens]|uniref:S6 family peptidase n=1 Tax=Buttiauxella selenatireducens TaxID=3073902 RepID=A0ABY9S7S2_9ENTR|nr:S6 family peptidase [Buttiauxella sp. R73]WMY73546.1 S6 family peptidase [Buttiauxella sp. R73]
MKFKKKLLASLIFAGQIDPAAAALMRDDIDVQVYRDFGENRGAFSAGATNIPVYHTDGSLSGIINVMPDFSASVDGGFSTLINSQVTATATHVPYNDNISFGKRYQQLDGTLFSGAENESSYALMNEVTKSAYELDAGSDYKITRERTIVTDAAPAELFTDTSQFKAGLLIARTGGGYLAIATDVGEATYIGYGPLAGGFNIINGQSYYDGVYNLSFLLPVNQITALDVGTLSGDSGSGMWGWDVKSQSWKFLGVNSAGSGAGYNKWTFLRTAPDWTQVKINDFNDSLIATSKSSDIIYVGAQDIYTGEGDFNLNGNSIRYHGIRTDIAASARASTDFMSNKNLILGGAGGTLELTAQNLDMGAGSLTFNSNYILSDGGDSTRRMNTAGYIINLGATVISNLTGSAGDIWRKIGLGTLVISGNNVNHSSLYVGDGLTILQRIGGHAADAIHITSGRAIVRLGAAGQLDGTQVGFGVNGGVLDLYGQSLSWNDIIHMDNGATIGTSKANALSTFTFTGSGPKTYLGNFFDGGSADKGLLHLVYAPGTAGSSWTLKGNVNTRAGMDILNGNLAIQGAYTLHAGGYIDPTQYDTASFNLGDSLVNLTGSQFTVGRNAMARGRFELDDASSLVMTSGGEVSSSQQGINEGAYLDGSVNLSGIHSVLKVTPEEAFRIQIDATLSGAGHIIKEGLGTLYLTGINTLTGTNFISSGRVITETLASLGMQSNGWNIAEAGVLDVGNNANSFASILEKISDDSRGVLALTGAITSADMMALLTKDLYLGSSSLLELGISGQNLTYGAKDLYLGGGDGEVKINGYLPSSGSSLFLGNGQSAGTVHIASMNENWVGDIELRRGINLITDYENSLGNGRLNVNYGSVAGFNVFKNVTEQSSGMIDLKVTDSFGYDMSAFQQLAIGALAGETLTLINTLKPTQTGYYFSGGGDVFINSALLSGYNLSVDAQDNAGGVITLNTVNDLNSEVTVRGYNSGSPVSSKSDMTLKMGVDNAIDKDSHVVLEDGGVIDLNGHSVTLNVESNSHNSKIISSDKTHASTLKLQIDESSVLNSLISGADMHLIKTGAGTLALGGMSTFTGDVLLSEGKTLAGSNQAFGAAENIVTVARGAMLDLNGHSVSNMVSLSSASLMNSGSGAITLGGINLNDDSTATFSGTTDVTTIGKYQLNGKRLTVNNINTEFAKDSLTDGDIVFKNSKISWGGSNHSLFSGEGSLTVGQNTVLELRDVIQTTGQAKTLVLDGGTIASGTNGNGGGAGATLRSALLVDTSGTLNGNNWGFGINLGLYGAISGSGALNITGGQGVSFYGDTSAFTGNLLLKNGSRLYLTPVEDTALAANLAQEGTGKAYKTGDKNLTLTGDNHLYTNELDVQAGTLTLGRTAAATGGDIRMTAGTLKLDSDSNVSFSNLAAGSTVDLHGHSGTLNIKANVVGSTITSSDTDKWSSLNLLIATNTALNSTITGQKIHLNKQGTGSLTLAGSNTFTGDALLSGGKTILGNSQALGDSANKVTVASSAILDQNGYDLLNGVIFDGGILTSSSTALNQKVNGTLNVATSGTLLGLFSGMNIYGGLSGSGTLNISGPLGANFFGDISAFTGKLLLKTGSQLYLSSLEDTTLAANLAQEGTGKAYKTGDKNLTLTGDNHLYTNELDMQGGTLTLGSTAAATGGDIRMTTGTLKLDSDSNVSLSNLAKDTTVDLHGHSGTLNIKANAAGSTITSSDLNNWSALNLLIATNTALNSTITGQKIHLNKQGTGSLTLAGSNTFTGDALLSGGKTILGNSQALGDSENKVTVASTATLDQNGYDLLNGVILDGGTLTSGSAALDQKINGTLDVASLGTLLGEQSGMNVYGAISGSGTLNITGSQGASFFGDTSAFTGNLWVKNSSQLVLASTQDTTLAANLRSENDSKIIKEGNHALTLSGDNSLWDSLLDLTQGDLIISQAQSTPAGEIAINGGRLIFAADDDMTPDTLISGSAGQMVKRGNGRLTLNQENTFDQETRVEEGILEIGDEQHDWASLASDVLVSSGGTLQGYGSIGGDLLNSGHVRPAGAGKSLRVSGNYAQTADAWLLIDIDPLEGASVLGITGHATLAGGLQTIYAPGTYTPQSYVFLTAQGGIEGEFASLNGVPEGFDQQLSYRANDVSLTTSVVSVDPVDPIVDPTDPVIDPIVDPTDPVIDPIVDPTDPVIDPIVDPTDPVIDPIVDPTDPVIDPIVDPTDPVIDPIVDPTDPVIDPIVDPTDPVIDPIVDPTDPVVDPIVDPTDPVIDPIVDPTDPVVDPIVDPTDPVTPTPQPTFVVTPSNLRAYDLQLLSLGMQKPTQWSMDQVDWSKSSGGKSICDLSGSCYHDDAMWIMPHMSNGNTADNGSAKVDGISIGGYTEQGNTRFGVSVDYSDFDLSAQGSSASADRYAVNLFASQKLDSMVLTGALGYIHSANEVKRDVTSNGLKLGEGESDITGNALSAGLSANWAIQMGNTTIVPQVGIDSLNVFYSGYDEHMSSEGELFGTFINKMKVHGDSDRYDSVQPNVGVKISHDLTFGNTQVTPALKVTYRRELMNNNDSIVASNDGTLFAVQSDTLGRDIIEYEAGVEVKFTPHLSTSFSYTGSNQQGYQSQEGMIRVKYNF